ncbi:DUF4468 domain-containing protein [Flavobacterium sediminilitoris]|uniref:DUF4468 domain-containing protein n=1 Tax=Flavobacterium sediminilitoris TaxID=2024526 RepID=A0ABY4HI55_9FLAO|nr:MULTISPECIES: DUF4468 domain-containing protein [Flavobacterium]UOX32516.1 DUF4468 domain-containing protein [Flavobacterium sediminilitoris]
MKKLITSFTLFLTFSVFTFGQTEHLEKFEYSETGINDYIVTKIEDKTTNEIYSKTINWIKETYKNPDKVIKMEIENEKVRINSVASNLLFVKKMSFSLDYIIELSIKDGKYKFELISLTAGGTDYKKIPNFKTDNKLIKNFGESPKRIENYLNNLNESLRNYILGEKKNDDW